MNTIGISPGTAAALALVRPNGTLLHVRDLPTRQERAANSFWPRLHTADFLALLREWEPAYAALEIGEPHPTDRSQQIECLRISERIGGILAALNIRIVGCRGRDWRHAMRAETRNPSAEMRHAAVRMRAAELWGDFSRDFSHPEHGYARAHAALLARYGATIAGPQQFRVAA